jgi:hypothetical protein
MQNLRRDKEYRANGVRAFISNIDDLAFQIRHELGRPESREIEMLGDVSFKVMLEGLKRARAAAKDIERRLRSEADAATRTNSKKR